jgi:excisionase family DNA binding protein
MFTQLFRLSLEGVQVPLLAPSFLRALVLSQSEFFSTRSPIFVTISSKLSQLLAKISTVQLAKTIRYTKPRLAYDLLFGVRFRSTSSMKKLDAGIKLLTLAEAAIILKISKRTLHRMIQHRQIPAFKVGGQWRILESRFQEWVQEEENLTTKSN